jgi:hypothetical protein
VRGGEGRGGEVRGGEEHRHEEVQEDEDADDVEAAPGAGTATLSGGASTARRGGQRVPREAGVVAGVRPADEAEDGEAVLGPHVGDEALEVLARGDLVEEHHGREDVLEVLQLGDLRLGVQLQLAVELKGGARVPR